MKIVELFTGLRYMMTNEQKEFIAMLKKEHTIPRSNLEERQQVLAERMTSLGLIDRIYDENSQTVAYKLYTR
jgi:predicted glycosyltransferase